MVNAVNCIRLGLGAWQIQVNDIKLKATARMERVCDHCKSLSNGADATECEDEVLVVFLSVPCMRVAETSRRNCLSRMILKSSLNTETREC